MNLINDFDHKEQHYDIIVIGGGLAGLRALELFELENQKLEQQKQQFPQELKQQQQQQKRILLLESRDRVGGRTSSIRYQNYDWDVGGQWVGPTQHRVRALLKQCGANTFPQQQIGRKVLEYKGLFNRYTGMVPNVQLLGSLECQLCIWRLEFMCSSIDPNAPWTHKNAIYWDSMTVQQWMDKNMYTDFAKTLVRVSILAVFSSEPSELSFFYVLSYFSMAGGVMKTMDVKNGAQQDRILGGSLQLSVFLYEKNKRNILLSHPVIKISKLEAKGFSKVQCENGKIFTCKKVIITLPPPLINAIEFQPPLPERKSILIQSMTMGQVIKFIIFYKECFWRDEGFSGEIVSDRSSISLIYDGSFEDGSKPSLIGFFEGEAAREWSKKTEDERKKEVTDILYDAFHQDKRVYLPINYIEMNWMEEKYTKGGYAATCNCNIFSKYGHTLREPIDDIHFAGTETATQWPGYMEGALQSAERVVNEILNQNTSPVITNSNFQNTNILIVIISLIVLVISYYLIVHK
ncbi:amine oxidase (flavin-containing) [Tieghemostelium lacteum]|uniref:Amine oxidase n=1 Tax=Tieghemostelium lacteum TaxID=361077 RepID=A0A152A9D3_TIELA|nr:amine oxidase (flavin-containing) [Tieghemostelium lacteum]|eukprot:KYR02833.1 amine oxidase (flavin-containing) [Tieghemostelium lacteum]